jgi:hypothetical protein
MNVGMFFVRISNCLFFDREKPCKRDIYKAFCLFYTKNTEGEIKIWNYGIKNLDLHKKTITI